MRRKGILIGGGVLLLLFFGLFIFLFNNEDKKVNTNEDTTSNVFKNVNGILIYGDWYYNISLSENKKVRIKIPVFDFSDNNELDGADISVENFSIGSVENVSLHSEYATPYYAEYSVEFEISSNNLGKHSLKDLELVITTPENKYREFLGLMDIEILDSTKDESVNPIESIMTRTYPNQPKYDYSHKVELLKDVELKRISLIENDHIKFINEDLKFTKDNKGFTRIDNTIDLGNYRNVFIVPKLTYKVEGKEYTKPLSYNVYRPTFPDSELKELLIKKGMVKE